MRASRTVFTLPDESSTGRSVLPASERKSWELLVPSSGMMGLESPEREKGKLAAPAAQAARCTRRSICNARRSCAATRNSCEFLFDEFFERKTVVEQTRCQPSARLSTP
jgi:hypothetical protein